MDVSAGVQTAASINNTAGSGTVSRMSIASWAHVIAALALIWILFIYLSAGGLRGAVAS